MRIPLLALMIAALLLPGCARLREARINPFNWFKTSEAATLEPSGGYTNIADNRALVDQVLTLVIDPVPGGALVRATGLPPSQGYWSAALVNDSDGKPVDGTLTYRFVVYPPATPAPISTQASREITAGIYISTINLADVRQISVVGSTNLRTARR